MAWAERRLGRPLRTGEADRSGDLGILPVPTGARVLGWTEEAVRQRVTIHYDPDLIDVVYVKDLWMVEVQARSPRRGIAGRTDLLLALQEESVVYFIQGAGLTKIGTSLNVSSRLAELRVGSPVPLDVAWVTPGGPALEAALHARFAAHRRHGEWFCLSNDEMQEIVAEFPLPSGFRRTRGVFSYVCTCGVIYTRGGTAARRCSETHDEDEVA